MNIKVKRQNQLPDIFDQENRTAMTTLKKILNADILEQTSVNKGNMGLDQLYSIVDWMAFLTCWNKVKHSIRDSGMIMHMDYILINNCFSASWCGNLVVHALL